MADGKGAPIEGEYALEHGYGYRIESNTKVTELSIVADWSDEGSIVSIDPNGGHFTFGDKGTEAKDFVVIKSEYPVWHQSGDGSEQLQLDPTYVLYPQTDKLSELDEFWTAVDKAYEDGIRSNSKSCDLNRVIQKDESTIDHIDYYANNISDRCDPYYIDPETTSTISTGDTISLVWRQALPVVDMSKVVFNPVQDTDLTVTIPIDSSYIAGLGGLKDNSGSEGLFLYYEIEFDRKISENSNNLCTRVQLSTKDTDVESITINLAEALSKSADRTSANVFTSPGSGTMTKFNVWYELQLAPDVFHQSKYVGATATYPKVVNVVKSGTKTVTFDPNGGTFDSDKLLKEYNTIGGASSAGPKYDQPIKYYYGTKDGQTIVTVSEWENITPIPPEGKKFVWWCTDKECTQIWKNEAKMDPNQGLYLYAKYVDNLPKPTITDIQYQDGKAIKSMTITVPEALRKPAEGEKLVARLQRYSPNKLIYGTDEPSYKIKYNDDIIDCYAWWNGQYVEATENPTEYKIVFKTHDLGNGEEFYDGTIFENYNATLPEVLFELELAYIKGSLPVPDIYASATALSDTSPLKRDKVTSPVTGISINGISVPNKVKVGDNLKFELNIEPTNDYWISDSKAIWQYQTEDSSEWQDIEESSEAFEANANGRFLTVKVNKGGKFTIKAILDKLGYTATYDLNVLKQHTKDDEVIKSALESFKTYTPVVYKAKSSDDSDFKYKTLSDVSLPSGWKWMNGDIELKANASAPKQNFVAVYESEGFEDYQAVVSVPVTEIKNIEIIGLDSVVKGQEETYSYKYSYIGAKPNVSAVNWSVDSAALEVKSFDGTDAVIKISDKGKITAKLTFDGGLEVAGTMDVTSENIELSVATRDKQPEKAVKLGEEEAKTVYGAKVRTSFDYSKAVLDPENKKATNNLIQLTTNADSAAVLKYATSDSAVMTVNNTGLVTIKKPGIAVITVSKMDGKVVVDTGSITISALDYEPSLDTTKYTVKQYNTNGAAVLDLVRQNGNNITDVYVVSANSAIPEGTHIEASKVDDVYVLKATGFSKNTTVKDVVLKVTTAKSEYTKKVTVVVDVAQPEVANFKFKQTVKPNAFYKDSKVESATVVVTPKNYIIADVVDSSAAGDAYKVAAYNAKTGEVTIEAVDLGAKLDGATKNYKVKAKIIVAGYTVPVDCEIPISVVYTKPSLKIEEAKLIEGSYASEVTLLNGKITLPSTGMTFTPDTKNKPNVTLTAATNGKVSVVLGKDSADKYTAGSYKVTVNHPDWTSSLVLSGKVSTPKTKDIQLAVANSKLTINTGADYNSPEKVTVYVKGNENLSVDITASSNKPEINVRKLDANTFEVYSPDEAKVSGKVTFTAKYNGTNLKPVSVNVALINSPVAVAYSVKGKINMANRAGSSAVVTPKISNGSTDTEVSNMRINKIQYSYKDSVTRKTVKKDCDDQAMFTAEYVGGKLVIQAKEGVRLTEKSYFVTLDTILSNGQILSKEVTVGIENKLPKIKSVVEGTNILYKTNTGKDVKYSMQVPAGYEVSNIICDSTANFNVESTGGDIVITLKNANKVKTGKYNIALKVYLKDADETKPVSVKCAVVVK